MKHIELTSEWIENWKPAKNTELGDKGCAGLVIRGGPSGKRTFYRWQDTKDETTGKVRRRRIKLGRWPGLSLAEARKTVNDARETRHEAGGTAALTVKDLAEAYRKDILAAREPASLAWSWGIIRTHVLPAIPDRKRPPFGEWLARDVKPADVSALVRLAKEERTAEVIDAKGKKVSRQVGGKAVARAALQEIKALFATAVGAAAPGIATSPAAILQPRALGLGRTKRRRDLDREELAALFLALDLNALLDGTAKEAKLSETVRLATALLFYVPVRTYSLIAAEWSEMDLEAGRWVIPPAKLKLHQEERAESRPFTIPLPGTAVAILRKLRELAGESKWVLASPKNQKKHINRKALVRAFSRLQESGRLAFAAKRTIHNARHTWRTWAGELGVSFEVGEKSLAHVLPGVAPTYLQAEIIEQRAQAAELVAAAFDRIRLGKAAKVVPIGEAKANGSSASA